MAGIKKPIMKMGFDQFNDPSTLVEVSQTFTAHLLHLYRLSNINNYLSIYSHHNL